MLTVKELCFRYHGGPEILKSINFQLESGKLLAILGNNGVGKSTMLKCFHRMIRPDSGSIVLDGEELLHMTNRETARRVAMVSQCVPITQITVYDMVMLGRRPYMQWGFTPKDHQIVHEALECLDIMHLQGRFLNELSGGERQKVMIARTLAQQPGILLLDEPTSNLDLSNQHQVLKLVSDICHEKKITALMVIHDLNLALRFCDRFLLLNSGGVYCYGNAEILDRKALWDVYKVHGDIPEVQGQKILLVDSVI